MINPFKANIQLFLCVYDLDETWIFCFHSDERLLVHFVVDGEILRYIALKCLMIWRVIRLCTIGRSYRDLLDMNVC